MKLWTYESSYLARYWSFYVILAIRTHVYEMISWYRLYHTVKNAYFWVTFRSHSLVKCSAYARTGHFGFLMIKHEISCFSPKVSLTKLFRLSAPALLGEVFASLCPFWEMNRFTQFMSILELTSFIIWRAFDCTNSVLSRFPKIDMSREE